MEDDGLLVFGSGIDLRKVPSLERKRVVAFVNFFAMQTLTLLTELSSVCEHKFEQINNRMERAKSSLAILEAKLSSIPDLLTPEVGLESSSSVANAVDSKVNVEKENTSLTKPDDTVATSTNTDNLLGEAQSAPAPQLDPAYQRYFKMAKVGIPVASFRNEMIRGGLDPDLLDSILSGATPASVISTVSPDKSEIDVGNVDDGVESDNTDDSLSSASSFSD